MECKNVNDNIREMLLFLTEAGWSDLIDNRWTLEVLGTLKKKFPDVPERDIVDTLNIVIIPQPEYDPELNEFVEDYHGDTPAHIGNPVSKMSIVDMISSMKDREMFCKVTGKIDFLKIEDDPKYGRTIIGLTGNKERIVFDADGKLVSLGGREWPYYMTSEPILYIK